jgi:hypothetical protein
MARLTINEIMESIAATVNQEASSPTAGGAEYNLWLEFINRAQSEWAEANDWEELRKYFSTTVTGMTQATVSLPNDYRKAATAPRLYNTGNTTEGEEFPTIPVEERGLYDIADKYVYELGNYQDGKSLIFHPATLASGASIVIQYFSTPTSLASPTQVPPISDSQYLIDRTISYIFEARSDPRFQQQESKAREKLLSMVENANLSKYNSYGNPQYVKNAPLTKLGFRIGRD